MQIHKKSQTSTEYLIILAVVIIIALIAIGVLGRIPLIGGGAGNNADSSYWATEKIGVKNVAVTPDGNITATLVNNAAESITINDVQFTDTSGQSNASVNISASLNPGQSTTLTVTEVSSGNPGDRFSYSVLINYTDSTSGLSYTFTGNDAQLSGVRSN